ncbi:DUF4099 domain-containing protein [Pedobacter gandavensis]|uniref:Uncharacterized protein DUF3945 n=2 Tax=Pedobacter TaxID=84567 RepID=A0A318UET6_9SPHI|nr:MULTISPECIES: DUF4099 domain-containing protein [Pedobacter]PYF74603.1 uncharacterized protein DUF3945 [Pedobacter nutrimenti]WGQ09071.1 DUF4099 domain-containing protein [Pedobacter gandavensis]SHG05958.1 Protein of unknown function [Pedobacter caeni]
METFIKENELPIKELEKLGLYQEGKLNLSNEDVDALLAGRRTDMRSMFHLKMDGFEIRQLDAKLSLNRNPDGTVTLNLHPIYKEVKPHPLLSEEEARVLLDGKLQSIQKVYEQADKKLAMLIIEYDKQTREFVSYHPEQVEAPIKINGQVMSEEQQKAFQRGDVIELDEGTRIQHSATDSKGIRSDRKALILSVLMDGGISYLLLRGIRNLAGNKDGQKEEYTKGYNQALADSMVGKPKREKEMTVGEHKDYETGSQYSRGYGRTSSR